MASTRSRPYAPRLRVPRRPGIPCPDLGALRGPARRTLAVRTVLGVALVAVLASAVLSAKRLDVRQGGFLPVGSSGVVVLDLSTSVSETAGRRIHRVLGEIVRADEPAGLVLFSDTAYEAVPPGSRGVELRPFLRYYAPRATERGRSFGPRPLRSRVTPWVEAFRGGTRISAGLRLARSILERDGLDEGSVLLVSDLKFSPFDLSDLTGTLIDYRVDRIPLRIVPLFASSSDRKVFSRLLGEDALVSWDELRFAGGATANTSLAGVVPRDLVLIGLLLLALLAVNELACARLSLPSLGTRPAREGDP